MNTDIMLFSPYQLGDLELPNRIVMAPMTRNRAGVQGVPSELNAAYYAQRATAGLIVTEGTYPHPSSRGYVGQPGIYTDEWKFLPHDIEETDTEAIYPYLAQQLSPLDLAYLHVQLPLVNFGDRPNAPFDVAKLIRPHFRGSMIVDGSLDREQAIARLEAGDADLVAFGRAFLANPDLPQRLREKAPLNEVDYSTFYTPGAKGYTDYPTLAELQTA